jgi:hypothetical protein
MLAQAAAIPHYDSTARIRQCAAATVLSHAPAGFQQQGASNGTSGGSAISAAGWRFNICQDRGRCKVDPLDGISQWYRRLWQVGC